VSRLGNPLVNEVVIGLPDKDFWNSTDPVNDGANFATYVTNPTLPAIIDAVYGTTLAPQTFPRTDLEAVFLTGIAPVNAFPAGAVAAEYIHLNTDTEAVLASIGITALPTPYTVPGTGTQTQGRLGAAPCDAGGTLGPTNPGCDPYGFPNGRRPIDDTIDIALDAVEGFLLAGSPATGVLFCDGVDQGATVFQNKFPYLGTPTPGANGNGT
jgi:hypothetical protein